MRGDDAFRAAALREQDEYGLLDDVRREAYEQGRADERAALLSVKAGPTATAIEWLLEKLKNGRIESAELERQYIADGHRTPRTLRCARERLRDEGRIDSGKLAGGKTWVWMTT